MHTDLLLVPFGTDYPALRSAAVAAEHAGFDGVWTWDHLRIAAPSAGSGSVPEALTALAGLAEATSRIRLGPLVLNVANRHPGLLANVAATLQQIAQGRFVLGLGAGGSKQTPYAGEQLALGRAVEADRVRAEQVAEAVQVIRLLWQGGTPSFEGKHYQLQRAAGYLRPDPAPPIIIAGFGPRMAAIAGRHGDGFNTQAGHPNLAHLIEIAHRERAASGRDPASFEVSVFAGLAERWLRPDGRERERLAALGVQRLILLVEPPFPVDQIASAGTLLRTAG